MSSICEFAQGMARRSAFDRRHRFTKRYEGLRPLLLPQCFHGQRKRKRRPGGAALKLLIKRYFLVVIWLRGPATNDTCDWSNAKSRSSQPDVTYSELAKVALNIQPRPHSTSL